MFSIHDRVSWLERIGDMASFISDDDSTPNQSTIRCYTGTIVSEEPHDHYLVKRDYDGKCQILCYRKLRLIDES